MIPVEQRRARIHDELTALREYRAMPETRILVALLDALADDYLEDLAGVQPDQLRYTQGALAQVRALRLAIAGDDPDRSPKA